MDPEDHEQLLKETEELTRETDEMFRDAERLAKETSESLPEALRGTHLSDRQQPATFDRDEVQTADDDVEEEEEEEQACPFIDYDLLVKDSDVGTDVEAAPVVDVFVQEQQNSALDEASNRDDTPAQHSEYTQDEHEKDTFIFFRGGKGNAGRDENRIVHNDEFAKRNEKSDIRNETETDLTREEEEDSTIKEVVEILDMDLAPHVLIGRLHILPPPAYHLHPEFHPVPGAVAPEKATVIITEPIPTSKSSTTTDTFMENATESKPSTALPKQIAAP